MDCHFLVQGIFLTQGLNLSLLLGRQILYHWATQEAPRSQDTLTLISDLTQWIHKRCQAIHLSHFSFLVYKIPGVNFLDFHETSKEIKDERSEKSGLLLGTLKWRKSCSDFRSRGIGLWPASDLPRHCWDSVPSCKHSKPESTLDKKGSESWNLLSFWGSGQPPGV